MWADCGSSALSTWCEHFFANQSRNYGTKSGIMISFPYKFGSLLKSHSGHFFLTRWPVPSPVSTPGTTRSTSLCRGESILSGLYPLSLDTSAAWRAQWWGDHTWQSCEILSQSQILIGLHHRSDSLLWWGILRYRSSLVSATFVACNGTGVADELVLYNLQNRSNPYFLKILLY